MKVNAETGLLSSISYQPSPYCDSRPAGTLIDLLVIHGISLPPGQFGSQFIQQFFTGKLDFSLHPYFATIATLQVSAHLLIDRAGQVTQFVPFTERAWHAGVSSFQGRSRCNDFSIGIELEGVDDLPYEIAQYKRLAEVATELMLAYPGITRERIVGHSDIAPGRKTDPGDAFLWSHFDKALLHT